MLVSALDCLRTKTAVSSSGLSFQASSHWPCDAWCGSGRRSRARPGQCRSRPRAPWPCRRPGWRASARRWSSLADAGDQVRLAAEAGNDRFEPGLLRPAIAVFRGSTGSPGRRCREPGSASGRRSVAVRGRRSPPPASAASRRVRQGGVAAVVEVQGFQFRLGRRSAPEQQGGTDDQHQGGDQKTAPVTFHDRHISVSPIQSGRRRSARRYRPGPPAGRARLARPGSGVPSRAGTCP